MPYRPASSSFPQPPRITVDQLTADRSLLDITSNVQKDPKYPHSIGDGASGNVYRGFYRWEDSTDGTLHTLNVVIKELRGTPAEKKKTEQRLNREIATWRTLSHPNISELLGIAHLNPNFPPGLVSRWVQRNNFLAYIGRHPELKRAKAKEIAYGLQYLHQNEVVHGDVKVDNILISDQGDAQITDFGIARILGVQGYTTMTSRNVRYAAPELRPITHTEEDMPDVRPTTASDIFSMGILLLQLFHGPDQNKQRGRPYNHVPYNEATGDYALLVRIHEGERPLRQRYNPIQDLYWILMQRCWAANLLERPDIAEVLQKL